MLEKLDGMFYQYHVKLVKFLLLEMYESLVFAFILPLAMLFSLIIVVINSFMHVFLQQNKPLVNLIHVVLGLYLILRSEFSNFCLIGNTSG